MKAKWQSVTLRAVLTAACLGMIGWIFSNSLQTAEASTEQSAGFMDTLQRFFAWLAPNSFIATATGKDYDRLHTIVRVLAHFCEFALLGALLVWCYRSYTKKRIWLLLPLACIVLVPITDELLQFFTDGRAWEITDVFTDVSGGICGGSFALFTIWLTETIVRKRKAKKEKKGEENGAGQLGSSVDKIQ